MSIYRRQSYHEVSSIMNYKRERYGANEVKMKRKKTKTADESC